MSVDTLSVERPVARKKYRCVYCYWTIDVGEKHYLWTGKVDGDFQSNRFHAECAAHLQDEYGSEWEFDPGGGVPPERLLKQREATQ
jgi:hypothetical protein